MTASLSLFLKATLPGRQTSGSWAHRDTCVTKTSSSFLANSVHFFMADQALGSQSESACVGIWSERWRTPLLTSRITMVFVEWNFSQVCLFWIFISWCGFAISRSITRGNYCGSHGDFRFYTDTQGMRDYHRSPVWSAYHMLCFPGIISFS